MAVENATDSLVTSGFPTSDISVLLPESLGGPKDIGTEKATKAPEGTAAGVTTGGAIGGTLGLLAGLGLLAIPGLGPFIAAGPIMAGLAGLGVGERWEELPAPWWVRHTEFEAKRYESRLQKGGILLSVHCDTSEEIKRAKEVMERAGGEDISSTGEASVDTKAILSLSGRLLVQKCSSKSKESLAIDSLFFPSYYSPSAGQGELSEVVPYLHMSDGD